MYVIRSVGFQALTLGLLVVLPGIARANGSGVPPVTPTPGYTSPYASEPVVMSGDRVASVLIPPQSHLFVGGLSDTGQLVFSAGALSQSQPELLLQYAGGRFTTIVAPPTALTSPWAGDVPWPNNITIARPLSMNARGNVVFTAARTYDGSPWGTFRWDAATGHTTALALKDMPATADLTFVNAGGYAPAINSSNEVALIGRVKNAAGTTGWGLFRLGRDGTMEPVCRPHEELPGGARISIGEYPMPSIDDTGKIAFLAHPDGRGTQNAYLWVHDAVTPILTVGATGPIGSKFKAIKGVFLNSANTSALVVASTDLAGIGRYGLFRVQNGMVLPVALPGQGMPGGGQLQTVRYAATGDDNSVPSVAVSPANGLGEHAFLATLTDGTQAAYKIDKNGGLSLVANATLTLPGTVVIEAATPQLTFVPGSRPALNKQGQIAFTVHYTGGPDLLVLMTPR